MKSFNVRHVQRHLAAVLAEVERGEAIEAHRRGQPVARIVPIPFEPPQSDWSHVEQRLREVYPSPSSGITAGELLRLAGVAADRMERGVRLLAHDADALDAFRTANRAVAAALARRLAREGATGTQPRWRAFQLAFILLNLSGISEPADPEREFVDLLFLPTGGGKTEAYLGLAAFTMVLRRLRPRRNHRDPLSHPDRKGPVAAIARRAAKGNTV